MQAVYDEKCETVHWKRMAKNMFAVRLYILQYDDANRNSSEVILLILATEVVMQIINEDLENVLDG